MRFLKAAWFGGNTSGRMRWHVEDAPIYAAMKADAMLDKGDLEGYAVWKRILRAVGELLSKERPDGATVQ